MHPSKIPFKAEDTLQGCRLILKPRQLGDVRQFAWAGIGIGLFGLVFMFFWMGMPLKAGIGMLQKGQAFGWALIGFGLLGLPGVLGSLATLMISIAVLREKTYTIIELRNDRLVCIEKFGWFRWTRKKAIADIDRLSIGKPEPTDTNRRRRRLQTPHGLLALIANGRGKDFAIGIAYSRDVLEPLAETLAQQIDCQIAAGFQDEGLPRNTSSVNGFSGKLDRVDVDRNFADRKPVKPSDSTIVRHEVNEAIIYEFPPVGIRKGSKGLFAFSLLWNTFMVVFTTVVSTAFVNVNQESLVFGLFLVLFWAIGIVLFVASINMGRRSTMIGIVGEELYVRTKSIFGEKDKRFDKSAVQAIEVSPSGMEINNVPVMELQIHHANGHAGFLSHRTDSELDWLAHELSELLNLRQDDEVESWKRRDVEGALIEPASGRIEMRSFPDRLEIRIPPIGFTHHLGLLIPGSLFLLAGLWLILLGLMGPGWIGNPFGQLPDFPCVPIGMGGAMFGAVMIGIWRLLVSRSFEIFASNAELTIERYGFLSRKTLVDRIAEIQFVDRQKSGVTVNSRPLNQLIFVTVDDAKVTLMTGWKNHEIDYVAFHVNRTLGKVPRHS